MIRIQITNEQNYVYMRFEHSDYHGCVLHQIDLPLERK